MYGNLDPERSEVTVEITSLILANLVTLTVIVLVWSAWPNMRGPRTAARKIARRGTGELHRGKTGSLAAS